MKTTIEIDDQLVEELLKATKTKTKKGAIVIAMKAFLENKRRESLRRRIGNFEDFSLTREELERLREDE